MLVRCKHTNLQPFEGDPALLARLQRDIHLDELPLEVGGVYVVFGVRSTSEGTWYYLCDADNDAWPTPWPAELFEVVDSRPSGLWERRQGARGTIEAPSEWVRDPLFYERLVDGRSQEVASFARLREAMALEFGRPDVTVTALRLDAEWVQCPACDEVWQATGDSALIRCPSRSCHRVMIRPSLS